MSKKKAKTYTFSMTSKQDKIVNIITYYEASQGIKMNRSAVVQRAIAEYARNYLPPEWYEKILAIEDDEEEEVKDK